MGQKDGEGNGEEGKGRREREREREIPRIRPSRRENCAPTPRLRSHFLLVYLLMRPASSN